MADFVISDFHDQHKNICGPTLSHWDKGYRDFDSLDSMHKTIVDNTNSMVSRQDRLFFLGDSIFGFNKLESFSKLFAEIECRNIVYIRGNHDDWMLKRDNLAEVEKIVGKVHDIYEENIDGDDCWFCHYSPEEAYSRLDINLHRVSQTREGRNTDFLDGDYVRDSKFYFFGHYHSTLECWGRGQDCGFDVEIPEIGHQKYFPFELKPLINYLRNRPCLKN